MLGLVLYLDARGASTGLGLATGALVLTRPDAVVVAAVLVAVGWRRGGARRLKRTALAFAAVMGVYAVVAELAIGQVFPSTLRAKIEQGRSGYFGDRWAYIRQLRSYPSGLSRSWLVLATVAAIVGFGLTLLRRERAAPVAMTVGLGAAVLTVGYVGIGIAPYPWYFTMPFVAVAIFAAIGIAGISQSLGRLGLPAVVVVSVVISVFGLRARSERLPFRNEWQPAGEWLAANTPSGARVAAHEVGMLGWYSGRPMVDYLGLFDRAAGSHVGKRDMRWWLGHYKPDYWVTIVRAEDAAAFEQPARSVPEFSRYRLVHTTGTLGVFARDVR
jgi:hypothetical protein